MGTGTCSLLWVVAGVSAHRSPGKSIPRKKGWNAWMEKQLGWEDWGEEYNETNLLGLGRLCSLETWVNTGERHPEVNTQ